MQSDLHQHRSQQDFTTSEVKAILCNIGWTFLAHFHIENYRTNNRL